MIDHLKITQKIAIEALSQSNNSDYRLVGIQPLKSIYSLFEKPVDNGEINDSCLFKNVFGYNTNFFYAIEQVANDKVVNYERGIGSIYEKEGECYLNRKISFVIGPNSVENSFNNTGNPYHFLGNNLILYSALPPTYFEALAPANCVLTSSSPCIPNPVVLKPNSLLGRIDDSIESISLEDNRLVDKIVNLFSKFSKQLKLKTSKLSLKRVEPEVVDFVPSSDVKSKVGSVYYDEASDSLKVHTKNGIRTLVFGTDL